jgi:putative DNA primase/helicase
MSTLNEQFQDAILSAGLVPPDVIEPGRFHRFPGLGKSAGNSAGWCKLFDCGTAGIFGDYSAGFSENWHAVRDEPLTKSERESRSEQAKKARDEADRKREATHAEAAKKAAKEWTQATPEEGGHSYLLAKCVKPHGIRTDGTDLLIPLRDGDGAIHSLQRITPDGSKRYLSGGAIKGRWFLIGEPADHIVIAEGFATCATIHEATGHAVIVAFDCGNLEPVARAIRTMYPALTMVIAADDDASTEGNPGMTKATAVADRWRDQGACGWCRDGALARLRLSLCGRGSCLDRQTRNSAWRAKPLLCRPTSPFRRRRFRRFRFALYWEAHLR